MSLCLFFHKLGEFHFKIRQIHKKYFFFLLYLHVDIKARHAASFDSRRTPRREADVPLITVRKQRGLALSLGHTRHGNSQKRKPVVRERINKCALSVAGRSKEECEATLTV